MLGEKSFERLGACCVTFYPSMYQIRGTHTREALIGIPRSFQTTVPKNRRLGLRVAKNGTASNWLEALDSRSHRHVESLIAAISDEIERRKREEVPESSRGFS